MTFVPDDHTMAAMAKEILQESTLPSAVELLGVLEDQGEERQKIWLSQRCFYLGERPDVYICNAEEDNQFHHARISLAVALL